MLVLSLDQLDAAALPLAGGKAANLGELLHAGLPIPPGFCLTTQAYDLAAAQADLSALIAELAGLPAQATERQAALAAAIRERLLATAVPGEVEQAVRQALDTLGPDRTPGRPQGRPGNPVPVAVRSSATAEDLPFASFAGQQDTYLNVVGLQAVLDAVRRCWASLWNERAVAYRAANGIPPDSVSLAVVVQRLVEAAVAGVVFTADPLTGRRRRTVVDASPGLGEAVVSGAVNPDHFVVDSRTGAVLERRLGSKQLAIVAEPGGGTRRQTNLASDGACLSDAQLKALAELGTRTEAHFGAPQDLEFALDADGRLWLTQARPITTLFPLPADAPPDDRDLRVYFNLSVAQGVFRPFTPMGIQAFRLIGAALSGIAGAPLPDPASGPAFLKVAAGRLFADVTDILRSPLGRRYARPALARLEARSFSLLDALLADSRLAARPSSPGEQVQVVAGVLGFLARTRFPVRVLRALLAPAAARTAAWRLAEELLADYAEAGRADLSAVERVRGAEQLLLGSPLRIFPRALPPVVAGMGALAVAWRLLGDLASPDERDAVTRALPHNPTTQMDLALWDLAVAVRADPAAAAALRERSAPELVRDYRAGGLPAPLQHGLASFLTRYGHRAVAEIDLGLPRWSDDPSHLLNTLRNYLALADDALTPDAQFRQAVAQAEATARELVRRASERGRWRGLMVRWLLGRGRALAGLREMPKFLIVTVLARARAVLAPLGAELVAAGRLDAADDVWFLTLAELRAALAGSDVRGLVRERQAEYERELRRRHLPRFLLSDGTEPGAGAAPVIESSATLRGTPASAGRVRGAARVILDPVGAQLQPGEILVAPSTDPGWTPLFLTAGGLVMEMGGAMSHGAVVAREYGIPAVVGVAAATERIADGSTVAVDGSQGLVTLVAADS